MKAWGLYAGRLGMFDPPELIEMFADQDAAEAVRDNLFGKQRGRLVATWVWEDDEDFPDLYVRPVEIRGPVSLGPVGGAHDQPPEPQEEQRPHP